MRQRLHSALNLALILSLSGCQAAQPDLFLPKSQIVFKTQSQPLAGRIRIEVSTVAGDGTAGFSDGPGKQARFRYPRELVLGPDGSLYVADTLNHAIRKISPTGEVSTLAGNGQPGYADGPGTQARFNRPAAVLLSNTGQLLVSDTYNQRIRAIDSQGIVTTLAGSGVVEQTPNGARGEILFPEALSYDAASQRIFVASTGGGELKTVKAQSFEALKTSLTGKIIGWPEGLAFDPLRQVLYLSETANHKVYPIRLENAKPAWEVNLTSSTLNLGDGSDSESTRENAPDLIDGAIATARFHSPSGLALDTQGQLYVADAGNHSIRLITLKGEVLTLAGNGQAGDADGNQGMARFNGPRGLAVSADGSQIFVADTNNHRIRKIRILVSGEDFQISRG